MVGQWLVTVLASKNARMRIESSLLIRQFAGKTRQLYAYLLDFRANWIFQPSSEKYLSVCSKFPTYDIREKAGKNYLTSDILQAMG